MVCGKGMSEENKRNYYRLVYPIGDRPILKLGKRSFIVFNVSEQGIKFIKGDEFHLKIDEIVSGVLVFGDRATFPIEARIYRIAQKQAVIVLSKNLPLKHIMEEQRYLIRKYGNLKS